MAYRQFVNSANPATTLSSSYTSGASSMSVGSVANLPSAGDFIILVDSEFFLVSAIAGSGPCTLTVAGAQEGSSAANHSSGANVYCILTAGTLAQVLADMSQSGAYASLPAAGPRAGACYRSSDAPYEFLWNGSAWNAFFQGYPVTIPPLVSAFSWVNQGASTANNTSGGLYVQAPIGAGDNKRMLLKALPTTPWSIVVGLLPQFFAVNYCSGGLVVRDSGSGKLITIALLTNSSNGALGFSVDYYNSPTNYSSTPFAENAVTCPVFFKLRDDGANFTWSLSRDGVNWSQIWQASRTAFLASPDQFGLEVDSNNAAIAGTLYCFHWLQGT